jgi:hypothetical protein
MLEGYLRLVDPWGLFYIDDIKAIDYERTDDRWLPVEGTYELTNFNITFLKDHSRYVPDTHMLGSCIIVAIGDSVTCGWGIENNETWLNLLANEFPSVRFINAGVVGYSTSQILQRQADYPEADGFLYLVTLNDLAEREVRFAVDDNDPYIQAYAKVWATITYPLPRMYETERFVSDVQQFEGDTLIMVHDNTVWQEIGYMDNVVWLDWTSDHISVVDAHPTAQGHEQLAGIMYEKVGDFIMERCTRG